MTTVTFRIEADGGARAEAIEINELVIAGWTGRDRDALEKHIRELEALGVARPASTPIYYRVSAARLTTAGSIECVGTESSGEVEFVLLRHRDELYVGVGSDHTDRKAEAYNVTVSKQMCDKPIAPQLWRYEDVQGHWDQLQLRAWLAGGETYQEGLVIAMRSPEELMEAYAPGGLRNGCAMFCGTLAAHGGVRASSQFRFELCDPVLARSIGHAYAITELPVRG